MDELECFRTLLYEETCKIKGRHPIINGDEYMRELSMKDESYPHPVNSFLQNEAMAQIWSSKFKSVKFGAGSGANAKGTDNSSEAEAPVEEIKERTVWDLKLMSFDAKKKISAIKEVKNLLGFGLKDAKEIVEKAPCILKPSMNKEEAEPIIEKLTKAGCVLELV